MTQLKALQYYILDLVLQKLLQNTENVTSRDRAWKQWRQTYVAT